MEYSGPSFVIAGVAVVVWGSGRGMYAFMQNVGMVNDHIHGCFRASDYLATARSH